MRCDGCGIEADALKTCRCRADREGRGVLCTGCWEPLRELVWIIAGPIACFGTCRTCEEWVSINDLRDAVPGGRRSAPSGTCPRCYGVVCAAMGRRRKLMDSILSGSSDTNIPLQQMVSLLEYLGFARHAKGSHHVFDREDIAELINLQETKGGKCKPYQVKQVRLVMRKYNLRKEV